MRERIRAKLEMYDHGLHALAAFQHLCSIYGVLSLLALHWRERDEQEAAAAAERATSGTPAPASSGREPVNV